MQRRLATAHISVMKRNTRLAAFTLMLGLFTACDHGALRGTPVDPAMEIPAFEFVRADGSPFRLGPAEGKHTVVFFGYTRCPDICPTTLADWTRVKAQLGDDASRVRFVFVSVDPGFDTPGIAQAYVARFDSSFIGVAGDSAATAAIERAFGVATIRTVPSPGHEHTVSHSPRTFLLDERGRVIAMYSTDTGWEALAADLRKLS